MYLSFFLTVKTQKHQKYLIAYIQYHILKQSYSITLCSHQKMKFMQCETVQDVMLSGKSRIQNVTCNKISTRKKVRIVSIYKNIWHTGRRKLANGLAGNSFLHCASLCFLSPHCTSPHTCNIIKTFQIINFDQIFPLLNIYPLKNHSTPGRRLLTL